MPEGVGYGPQNTASTGLNLNYVGNYAYAYSGAIPCSNSEKELLNFTTGSGVLVAKIKFAVATPAPENDQMRVIFELNGITVYQSLIYSGTGGTFYQSNRETVNVVIPSYSNWRVLGENITDASSRAIAVIISGKVIGKID